MNPEPTPINALARKAFIGGVANSPIRHHDVRIVHVIDIPQRSSIADP
jgi:hypothetical protein